MPTVGFEPTRANTRDLKSPPLDQLGHVGCNKDFLIARNRAVFHRYQTHAFACCNWIRTSIRS